MQDVYELEAKLSKEQRKAYVAYVATLDMSKLSKREVWNKKLEWLLGKGVVPAEGGGDKQTEPGAAATLAKVEKATDAIHKCVKEIAATATANKKTLDALKLQLDALTSSVNAPKD